MRILEHTHSDKHMCMAVRERRSYLPAEAYYERALSLPHAGFEVCPGPLVLVRCRHVLSVICFFGHVLALMHVFMHLQGFDLVRQGAGVPLDMVI
jgi:hypothetical protein